MVASVVKHENDTATLRSMPQQLREEALKGYGIEHLADRADELTGAQLTAPKQAKDLRVGACSTIGSLSSGGTDIR
jgi:hypothetical protein